jgi:hypothetical protein
MRQCSSVETIFLSSGTEEYITVIFLGTEEYKSTDECTIFSYSDTAGLTLQLEVPMMAVASIPSRKVGEECWNSSLDGRLEVVAGSIHLQTVAACIQLQAVAASIHLQAAVSATSEALRLRETLPTTSWVLDPYENPVT